MSEPKSDPSRSSRSARGRAGAHGTRPERPGRGRAPHADDRDEDLDEESEVEEEIPAGAGGFFPDLLRRGLTLGFTGVFMTEEAVRRALGDSVPRDLIEFFVAQSERTRAEFLDRLSREFGRVLTSLDPAEVARRLLEGRTVEVKASFRLVPDPRADAAAHDARAHGSSRERHDDDDEGGGSRSTRGRR